MNSGRRDRMICCFCGQLTDDCAPDEYVELRVSLPERNEEGLQWLGAHGGCLALATRGIPLIADLESKSTPGGETLGRQLIAVPRYRKGAGIVADVEGGIVSVEQCNGEICVTGDTQGLRDLARWCLAVADEPAPSYSHIHLDAGEIPLSSKSAPLAIARAETDDLLNARSRTSRIELVAAALHDLTADEIEMSIVRSFDDEDGIEENVGNADLPPTL